ncbi:MAG TPA: ClpXP protease specificity-enhancing factor [Ideonella sp.]|uniref:ClpXP protease specificity-enhancing factor n=1 Tax=Ideonella sp. TaxID=1929293 RepID=UPI002B6FD994|nr:ClpXP protease specificity-enhancing factor [Ideonella sp.]HSI51759.1 ClpXP protease specificity-enhancing factor [Ideonella sp.]
MSPVTPSDAQGSSTRPYLIRALHDWCTDNGFTPYLAVYVDRGVQVPMEYVKNNEIVLNVGFEATSGLKLGNDYIEFKARFGGVAREIVVPVDHVVAIYARENGQGMAFPMPVSAPAADEGGDAQAGDDPAERAPRGLRLAGTEANGSTPARPAPLASVPAPEPEPAAPTAATAPDASDDTPPPATPGGGRPALKRIK